jgi:hypothetical protein
LPDPPINLVRLEQGVTHDESSRPNRTLCPTFGQVKWADRIDQDVLAPGRSDEVSLTLAA